MGYKIRSVNDPSKFLEKDLNAFSKNGYAWSKLQAASNILEQAQKKFSIPMEIVETSATNNTWQNKQNSTNTTSKGNQHFIENAIDVQKHNSTFKIIAPITDETEELLSKLSTVIQYLDVTDNHLIDVEQQIREEEHLEQDILHKIEFEKMDAIVSCKLIRMLKASRINRRKLKDIANIIRILQTIPKDTLNALKQEAYQLEHRTYVPRANPELFKNDVHKEKN